MGKGNKVDFEGCFKGLLVLALGLFLCISIAYFMWVMGLLDRQIAPVQLARYEQIYSECMMQETIESDYCHDIAARQVYGE